MRSQRRPLESVSTLAHAVLLSTTISLTPLSWPCSGSRRCSRTDGLHRSSGGLYGRVRGDSGVGLLPMSGRRCSPNHRVFGGDLVFWRELVVRWRRQCGGVGNHWGVLQLGEVGVSHALVLG